MYLFIKTGANMRNTVWKFKDKIEDNLAYKLSKDLGIDPYLVRLLYAKGLKSKKAIILSSFKDYSCN